MTSECKKKVYRHMCETGNGVRHGRYKGITYDSNRKRTANTAAKTKAKGTAKAVPLATTKTAKKEDAIWKSMDRRMFEDDRPDIHSMKADRNLDVLDDEHTWEDYNKAIQRMYRDEQLRKAYTTRRTAKRKKSGTAKNPRDPSVWIPEIIGYPYIKYSELNGKSFIYKTDKSKAMPIGKIYNAVKSSKRKVIFMNPYEVGRGTYKDKKYVLKQLESRPDFKKE